MKKVIWSKIWVLGLLVLTGCSFVPIENQEYSLSAESVFITDQSLSIAMGDGRLIICDAIDKEKVVCVNKVSGWVYPDYYFDIIATQLISDRSQLKITTDFKWPAEGVIEDDSVYTTLLTMTFLVVVVGILLPTHRKKTW